MDCMLFQNKWVELFPSIVSRAKTLQIISSGVTEHASGSLHLVSISCSLLENLKIFVIISGSLTIHINILSFFFLFWKMYAELQTLSPLVPTREAHFFRYCQQNVEEGCWAIVDFPLESLNENFEGTSFPRYKRRPSGCIIQDMPNGYSRVDSLFLPYIQPHSML